MRSRYGFELCKTLITWFPLVCLTGVVLVVGGCGGNAESTVYGTVTLDGIPMDHGSVTFLPETIDGKAAAGSIDADGHYTVQASQTGGLPAGKYAVRVSSRAPSIQNPRGGPPTPGKLLTPKKYMDSKTSGLMFTLKDGSNEIDLKLKSQ